MLTFNDLDMHLEIRQFTFRSENGKSFCFFSCKLSNLNAKFHTMQMKNCCCWFNTATEVISLHFLC